MTITSKHIKDHFATSNAMISALKMMTEVDKFVEMFSLDLKGGQRPEWRHHPNLEIMLNDFGRTGGDVSQIREFLQLLEDWKELYDHYESQENNHEPNVN